MPRLAFVLLGLLLASEAFAQTGRIEKEIEGHRPVLAFIPVSVTSNTGLVIGLHGTSSSGNRFAGRMDIDAILAAGYVVVAPSSPSGSWGNINRRNGGWPAVKKDSAYIRAIIETFIREYNIHPGKIHSIGFSAGGFMSCLLAGMLDPMDGRPLRSVCAHSGGFTGEMTPKAENAGITTIWVLNGAKDGTHTRLAKTMHASFEKAGYESKYEEVPDIGHTFPLIPFSRIIAWWKKLDKDAPDFKGISSQMGKGERAMKRKRYGDAYRAFEKAKKLAGKRGEAHAAGAVKGLTVIEQKAKALMNEAAGLVEEKPAKAKRLYKKISKQFKGTPYADEAKKALAELKKASATGS